MARWTKDEALSVKCVICGAGIGMPCCRVLRVHKHYASRPEYVVASGYHPIQKIHRERKLAAGFHRRRGSVKEWALKAKMPENQARYWISRGITELSDVWEICALLDKGLSFPTAVAAWRQYQYRGQPAVVVILLARRRKTSDTYRDVLEVWTCGTTSEAKLMIETAERQGQFVPFEAVILNRQFGAPPGFVGPPQNQEK